MQLTDYSSQHFYFYRSWEWLIKCLIAYYILKLVIRAEKVWVIDHEKKCRKRYSNTTVPLLASNLLLISLLRFETTIFQLNSFFPLFCCDYATFSVMKQTNWIHFKLIYICSSIQKYDKHYSSSGGFEAKAFFQSVGDFCRIFSLSLLIGAVMGCATALCTKFTRIRDFPLLESALFVLMSYSTFLIAEVTELTGGILNSDYH